ncbi:MAG TPA: PilZ domain-containing protein [Acidimicrobiales bacterium]|nr:PilZ domain-containing protein [Acidimicrobiales bacterium]
MAAELAPRLVRRFAWTEDELVEGTEALLWDASGPDVADVEEPPDPRTACRAVISWVHSKIIRFETSSPEPLPELMLVSTLAVAGPAHFVVRKQYQRGRSAAYDPPRHIYIVERRDLFRIPVATRVTIDLGTGRLSAYSVDCSVGGVCICPSQAIEVGREVDVVLTLGAGNEAAVRAVVRHCRPYAPPGRRTGGGPSGAQVSMVGLQFLDVPSDVERHLTQFVGYHQRRLMPRVNAVVPLEYRSHGRNRYVEAFSVEVSPGDVAFLAHELHQPGDAMDLKLRLNRQDYILRGCTLSCTLSDEDGPAPRHVIRASLQDSGEAVEAAFRKAVRELAIERIYARDR